MQDILFLSYFKICRVE